MISVNSYLNHTKNDQMIRAEEEDFSRFKLVYFKTLLLELVECSMEVPLCKREFAKTTFFDVRSVYGKFMSGYFVAFFGSF